MIGKITIQLAHMSGLDHERSNVKHLRQSATFVSSPAYCIIHAEALTFAHATSADSGSA